MATLTSGVLANLRRAAAGFLTDVCLVKRATVTPDAAGGATATIATAATVACSIQPARRSGAGMGERAIAGRMSPESDYVIYVPDGTDVTERDQIAQTTGETTTTYEVIEVLRRAGQEPVRAVGAKVVG